MVYFPKFSVFYELFACYLTHLWGTYAIPLAFSVVKDLSCVACVHYNYITEIIKISNRYFVQTFMGGVLCISDKVMGPKPYFHIFNFFSEPTINASIKAIIVC